MAADVICRGRSAFVPAPVEDEVLGDQLTLGFAQAIVAGRKELEGSASDAHGDAGIRGFRRAWPRHSPPVQYPCAAVSSE
jgi:hypothetical protein